MSQFFEAAAPQSPRSTQEQLIILLLSLSRILIAIEQATHGFSFAAKGSRSIFSEDLLPSRKPRYLIKLAVRQARIVFEYLLFEAPWSATPSSLPSC